MKCQLGFMGWSRFRSLPNFIRQVHELYSAGADGAKRDASQAGLNKDTPAILGRHLQVKNMVYGDLMSTSNSEDFGWVSTILCHVPSTRNEEGAQHFV